MSCAHEVFAAKVDVARLTAEDGDDHGGALGFTADIRLRCAQCDEPFVFRGELGWSAVEPRRSLDGLTLSAPCGPLSDPGFGSGLPGLNMRRIVGG